MVGVKSEPPANQQYNGSQPLTTDQKELVSSVKFTSQMCSLAQIKKTQMNGPFYKNFDIYFSSMTGI